MTTSASDTFRQATLNAGGPSEIRESLLARGLPNSKWGEFTYINTKWLAEYAGLPHKQKTALGKIPSEAALLPVENAYRVVLSGDALVPHHSQYPPEGVQVTTSADLPGNTIPFPQNTNLNQIPKDDFFHSLIRLHNAATTTIRIPEGVTLTKPLEIIQLTDNADFPGKSRSDRRVIFSMGAGSACKLILSNSATQKSEYMDNAALEFILAENANCEALHFSRYSEDQLEMSRYQFTLQKGAEFTGNLFSAGSKLCRHSIEVRIMGSEASFNWNSTSLPQRKNQFHSHLVVHHNVPESRSNQTFKNILKDETRCSTDSTVVVHPGAQLTKSQQIINNLVLSDGARASTKPNLIIFADDVKCNHGATQGQLDPEHLFYLQSRGLNREQAFSALVNSFINDKINRISHEGIRHALNTHLQKANFFETA